MPAAVVIAVLTPSFGPAGGPGRVPPVTMWHLAEVEPGLDGALA